nr:hypothetical protein CFP56_15112 [Quercus suber]
MSVKRLWRTSKHQRPLVSSPLMSSSKALMKHHFAAVDYFDLDFKAIDKEMMAYERARANEQDGVEGGNEGEGPVDAPVDPPADPAINPIV